MDKASIIFCGAALAGSLLIAAAAFPFAALPVAQFDASRTAKSAEAFADVDLGDFGQGSVLDLVSHYVENPPEVPAGGAEKVRFQGC